MIDKKYKGDIDVILTLLDERGPIFDKVAEYILGEVCKDYMVKVKDNESKLIKKSNIIPTHVKVQNHQLILDRDTEAVIVDLFRKLLSLNEASDVASFDITKCSLGKSGYTFGPLQWDLKSGNQTARDVFVECLSMSKILDGVVIKEILDEIDDNNLSDIYNELIDSVLDEPQIVDYIESETRSDILDYIGHVIIVINRFLLQAFDRKADYLKYEQLYSDIFFILYLMDYHNQFYISFNGKMVKTINDFKILDYADLIEYITDLKYARKNLKDLSRRFFNIRRTYRPASIEKDTMGKIQALESAKSIKLDKIKNSFVLI